MRERNKKENRKDSGKKNILAKPIEKIGNTLSGVLLLEKDDAARRRRRFEDELKVRIEGLEEPECPPLGKIPSKEELKQIIEKESKQKEDRVVWKAYSKRGGISDTLTDIRKAVERPSANAFEFYEEEGMYTIFITLNNTYISRLVALCNEMCSEYEQIEKEKMEDSKFQKERDELQKERDEIQKIYNKLCSEKEKLSLKSFQQRLKSVKGEEQEKELKRFEGDLNSYEKKRNDHTDRVKAYEERLMFFIEECRKQGEYEIKYGRLLEKLTEIREKICEKEKGHPFHMLTISPEGEEALRQYMDVAREFSKWSLQITEEYPL